MSDRSTIEELVEAKRGITGPKITPQDIDLNIRSIHYFNAFDAVFPNGTFPDEDVEPAQSLSLLTFCIIVLNNGYTVTGESACVSPENFDEELGREIAKKKAMDKIWPLMGYHLKQELYEAQYRW